MHGSHKHRDDEEVGHGRAFLIATTLNLAFVVLGVVYGILSHSTALLADAAHNLGDVLGLVLAWGASVLAKRSATHRRTYGLRRSTILAAFLNSFLLLFATGGVAWEAIRRLHEPAPVASATVMIIAGIGIAVNLGSSLPLWIHRKRDLNVRAAFMHLLGDAAFSLGLVVAGAVIYFTGWNWLDPVMSLVLAAAILLGTWQLLRGSIDLILDAVPEDVDPEAVRTYLRSLPGVTEVHHLHIWPLSTTETALTAHLVMSDPNNDPEFIPRVAEHLRLVNHIGHTTFQLELSADDKGCDGCNEPAAAPGS